MMLKLAGGFILDLKTAVTIFVAVMASSGFWGWVMKHDERKSARTRLLMGLTYDRLTFLGMTYIRRGWVSKDEVEDYHKYLYEPYKELGGNGTAERIMKEVWTLPLSPPGKGVEEEITKAKETREVK